MLGDNVFIGISIISVLLSRYDNNHDITREGMFLVGCCSWLQSILYISTKCFIRKKADVSTAILQCSSELTQHAQNPAYILNTRSRVE